MDNTDILILTASFGNGHNSATQALIDRFNKKYPEISIVKEDTTDITTPGMKKYFADIYDLFTKNLVPIYNSWYFLRDSENNIVDVAMTKLFVRKFHEFFCSINPKVLISVFPTSSQLASYYKANYAPHLKCITVITDVVSSWEWIAPNIDYYLVPTKEIKDDLIVKGVSENNIFVTGVPVREEFLCDSVEEKIHNQVLIMGSAMGKIDLDKDVIDRMAAMPYKFVIVAGKDVNLYIKISELELPTNIELKGFTKDIAKYMKGSDIIVTKPGGVTIFEAIAMNLPILIMPSNVGQEKANVEFVLDYGFGVTFKDSKDMIENIELAMNNSEELFKIKRKMIEFKKDTNLDGAIDTIYAMCK